MGVTKVATAIPVFRNQITSAALSKQTPSSREATNATAAIADSVNPTKAPAKDRPRAEFLKQSDLLTSWALPDPAPVTGVGSGGVERSTLM